MSEPMMAHGLRRRTALGVALALTLGACSKSTEPPAAQAPAVPVPPASAYDTVATQGKGFAVGALMAANPVYVLFDPQCPHCGHLWQAAQPLLDKVKFVWVPIAFNKGKSLPQAVALLQAADPAAAMSAHEQSLLAGQGGMAASSDMPDALAQAVKANTDLLVRLGVDSVPYVLGKNRRTGAVVSHNGAMDTAPLAQLLGVD
ncbi:MAG: hypothetical protein Fur007_07600 [Rhodoferax sp.]